MYDMMKKQRFGVEIELTGITRSVAAETLASLFGTGSAGYGAGRYNEHTATDAKGRVWKVVRDASIRTTGGDETSVEIVSPILSYEDIELIQEALRQLRSKGAKANDSCGIHIHVDGANHNPTSLKNIVNFMCSRQDLIYEALEVKSNRLRYCKKMCDGLLKKIKATKDLNRDSFQNLWYSPVNHDYCGSNNSNHYNDTRYQCVNLHSYFCRGTVEFRLFNSTTHAGELKSYIQFCLAVSAWALATTENSPLFKAISHYTPSQKAAIMDTILTKRLGLSGKEFKSARLHLTKHLNERAQAAA